jgi:nitrile hydratase
MVEFNAKKVAEVHQHLHSHLPSDSALRVKALETLLVEKGLINPKSIDAWIEAYTEDIGPKRGAHIVAKAWRDPDFKQRLIKDGSSTIDELDYLGNATGHLKVIENTASVHNLVVCTLCSCYPFSILGIAPAWYKAEAYRSRAVRDPRGVWDSTAELRYLVLPQRPNNTEALGEDELASLVTRNSMIGTDRDLVKKKEVKA